ncbi:MAG: VanZ family protein [Pirellulaceae bacterium]
MIRITEVKFLGIRVIVLVLAAYWLAIFTGTHLPDPPDIGQNVNDKVKHFGAYFGLTILLCLAVTFRCLKRRVIWVALIVATYGALDELTQQLVPGRYADVNDFIADLGGMTKGIIVYLLARWIGK